MLSSREVIHALANAFSGVSPRGDIHQPLVRSSVLKHSFYFPLPGQKNGAFVLLQLLHELPGISPECCERLGLFGNVEHGASSYEHGIL